MRKKALKVMVQYYQRANVLEMRESIANMEQVIKMERENEELRANLEVAEDTLKWVIEETGKISALLDEWQSPKANNG